MDSVWISAHYCRAENPIRRSVKNAIWRVAEPISVMAIPSAAVVQMSFRVSLNSSIFLRSVLR